MRREPPLNNNLFKNVGYQKNKISLNQIIIMNMKKTTNKVIIDKKLGITKSEKPKTNKKSTFKVIDVEKPLIKETINKDDKIISKIPQVNFNTCINCHSIPYFRIYVHDNKFELSILHDCKKDPQFTYDIAYNAYVNRKINKAHQCQKHNSSSRLYCINCKTWFAINVKIYIIKQEKDTLFLTQN